MVEGLVGLLLGFVIGSLVIGVAIGNEAWHAETIQRGLAQYCPNDGVWAWKGECK